jgi:hypothetical protein
VPKSKKPTDASRLSSDPRQVRNRLRRNEQKFNYVERDIEVLYQKPISEWDVEELARGRPRNSAGTFTGRKPGWLTPIVAQEARRRLHDDAFSKLVGHLDLAFKVIKNLLESTELDDKGKPIVDARTKLAAAQFIVEHVIGKAKSTVEIEAVDTTRHAIAAAIILDDGMPQGHLVIDGEVAEDGDEDELAE